MSLKTGIQAAAKAMRIASGVTREQTRQTPAEGMGQLLDQWKTAAETQKQQRIDETTRAQESALRQNLSDSAEALEAQRNQSDAEAARALDNSALYAEARGDRGGIGLARYQAIQATALQNRAQFQEARTRLAADTARQIAELFAHLCELYHKDPLADGVILSHREGHARGIATNHGDPEHLWNQLGMGYTMDGFRRDVKAQIDKNAKAKKEEEKMAKVYGDIQDVPAYWRDDMQELLDLGCVDGGTPADKCATDLNLTEDCIKATVIIKRYVDAKYCKEGK